MNEKNLISIFKKKSKIIFLITLIAFILSFIYYFLIQPKTYIATGFIFANMRDYESKVMTSEDVLNPSIYLPRFYMNSYMQILIDSENIKDSVINDIKKEHPYIKINSDKLKKMIKVENPTGTSILKLSVSYSNPNIALKICESYLTYFEKYVIDIFTKQPENALNNLNITIQEAKTEMDKAENELLNFLKENDLQLIQSDRDLLINKYEEIKKMILDYQFNVEKTSVSSKEIENLKILLQDLNKQINELNEKISEIEYKKYLLEKNLEIKKMNYDMFIKNYSNYKISEESYIPVYTTEAPKLPEKPKIDDKLTKTISITLFSFVISAFIFILLEFYKK